MPIGAIGASLIGTGVNAISQIGQNRANRKFAVERYNVERKDNRYDWDLQNAYNSPKETRKRLEEGGLNPALMYGGNQTGGSAGSVANNSTDNPETSAAKLDIGGYLNAQMAKAQIQKTNAEAAAIEFQNEENIRVRDGSASYTKKDYDNGKGTLGGFDNNASLRIQQQKRDLKKLQAEGDIPEAQLNKARKDLKLMEAQINNLNAQNLKAKYIDRILRAIENIYDQSKIKTVIKNGIQKAQIAERQ